MAYSFCQMHQTMRATDNAKPTRAMAAGVADHGWPSEEIVALIKAQESANRN